MNESLGAINLVVLAFPGAALLWTARLVYGRRGAASDDVLKRVLSTAGWMMLHLALAGLIVGMTGPFSVFSLLIVPAVLIMVLGQYRQSERRSLLDMLAIAAERGLPLDLAARAYAEERDDELGLRAGKLAELLAGGVPLPEALDGSGHYYLPTDAKLAVRVGWHMGTLGPALRKITGLGQSLDATLRTVSVKFLYLVAVFVVGVGVVSFVMIKIVPTFRKMFDEFELQLPPPTELLCALSDKVVNFWWIGSPLMLVVVMLGTAAMLNYVGWLPRWLPLVSSLTVRYDGALVMRVLSLAVAQQRSLVETLRMLSQHYPLKPVRGRLLRAVVAIDHGMDWCDALVAASLVRPADAAVLKAAQRVGNLEWALAEMADGTLRRAAYRWQSIVNTLVPILTILLGLAVAFIVISLFMPLIAMIQGLSG